MDISHTTTFSIMIPEPDIAKYHCVRKIIGLPSYLEKLLPLRTEGAAEGGARGTFSNYVENRPLLSKYAVPK